MSLTATAVDADGFRAALGAFASSVNVITMTDEHDRPLGMTATAFSSVSTDPLLALVCVNRSARTYRHIAERGRFGVNILGSVARQISDFCARPGTDKFLQPEWLSDADWPTPALAGALAYLGCEVRQDIEAGTHAVLIGAVTAIGVSPGLREHDPLVYFQGAYRPLQSSIRRASPTSLPILTDDILLENMTRAIG